MKPFFKNTSNATVESGVRLNRRAVTFLFCLAASTFFWIIQSLSKNYTVQIDFPVTYINLPPDKVPATPLPQTIEADVNARGFNYLFYKLINREKTISIDVKQLKRLHKNDHYYLLPNSKIEIIAAQFSENMEVLKVYPDTIFFDFNKKATKKVPVKANVKITFDDYYHPTDSLVITPNLITISGAKELVEKIKCVETKAAVLKKVNENILLTADILQTPELRNLELSATSVKASMSVAKFTEANIELPIEYENVPKGYSIKTFPDKVTVKYNVALENYEKIKSSDFRVVIDYSKNSKGSNKLRVELVKTPTEINSPKISPEKVEFIIRK